MSAVLTFKNKTRKQKMIPEHVVERLKILKTVA